MRHRLFQFACVVLIAGQSFRLHPAEPHSTIQPVAQDLKKLQLLPGLKIELVASEPLLENPVAFSIDGRGRFFVAETHRYRDAIFDITANTPWLLDDLSFRTVHDRAAFLARTFTTNFAILTNSSELIRLVEDRDHDGTAETSSIFADGFRESTSGTAAGVLAQGTNVWFTSIPDLWKFSEPANSTSARRNQSGERPSPSPTIARRPRNADSLIVDRLATGLGVHISVSGHDVHGLIRGPDGRIYFSFGDRGVCITNREGTLLNVPDTGGVLRCEPDGRNLEVFCTGLRNPQELAFDDYGNLWTVDNDTAGADPCRVLHLVEDADYGWRASYQHMKGFGPWVQEELWRGGLDGILPPAGTVSQGPAGLAFYPGTGLTPQLAGRFLHADFPGGIWAYSVKPRGASFELAEKEKVLWNCWPTDVDFGPDGALYVLDWVQGWTPPGKGRIYRLTSTTAVGPEAKALAGSVKQWMAEGMGPRSGKELLALLGHADRRVRLEAQWELAGRAGTTGLDESISRALVDLALESPIEQQRLHAIWTLSQAWREGRTADRDRSAWIHRIAPALEDHSMVVAGQAALALADAGFLRFTDHFGEMAKAPSPVIASYGVRALARLGDKRSSLRLDPPLEFRRVTSRLPAWLGGRMFNWQVNQNRDFNTPTGLGMEAVMHAAGESDPFLRASSVQWIQARIRSSQVSAGFEWIPAVWTHAGASNASARQAAVLALRRHHSAAVTNLLGDPDPRVILETVRAIHDEPVAAAYPSLAGLLNDPRFRDPSWGWFALTNTNPANPANPAGPFSPRVRSPREQILRRALNAHFRLGGRNHAEALAQFALQGAAPEAPGQDQPQATPRPASLRAEALFLLGSWEVLAAQVGDLPIKPARDPNHGSVPTVNPENWPGWFDRVVGLWRPLPPRSGEAAQAALAPVIHRLIADSPDEVALAAIEAATKLRLDAAAPALLARLSDRQTATDVRVAVPHALAQLNAPQLGEAVQLALADTHVAVRAAALPYLNRLEGNTALDVLGPIARSAIAPDPSARTLPGGELGLIQAALRVLGGLTSTNADALLLELLAARTNSRYPRTLELDLIEAAAKRRDDRVRSAVARITAANSNDELASWRPTLFGGDAARGRSIYLEKVEVQCSRCHQVKKEGGIVGPALDGLGKRQTREQILESILRPNKVIAPGFENVILTLTNGTEHAGVVKSENESELRLDSPEDGPLTIAKKEIADRRRSLSAMPEGLETFLTRRELRDLIEYLAGLK